MKTISQHLEKWLARLLVVLMITIVVDVTWQVISRFFLGDPSSFTEELARFLLMWIGLLGAAYAYRRHSHLSLDLLLMNSTVEKQIVLLRLIHCVSFLFAASAMVYGGVQLMALTLSLKQTSAALGVPMGYVYSCIPLSGILICWFAAENFLHPDPSILSHHE
jgi:TRAP-type C4-dicarboxylate transport system permease small subunit